MASLRPLLCVLLALSSRVLSGPGSRQANFPQDCTKSSKVHIPKETTKTFFVQAPNKLEIILKLRNCLDREGIEKQNYLKLRSSDLSSWREIQLSVNDEGYRVRVDGVEKLTDTKEASCHKVTDVDVNGDMNILIVDCDPRFKENISTSSVTTTESTTVSTMNSSEATTTPTDKTMILCMSIGSPLFMSLIIIISVTCLKNHTKKKTASLKNNVSQPTFEVNSQTAVNRSNDMGLNAPPPLPPAFNLLHAQSMNLVTAQQNDPFPSQDNLLFHTLPHRREFMGGSGNREQTSTEHLYEEVNENSLFTPLGQDGNQAPGSSHESINSIYAAL